MWSTIVLRGGYESRECHWLRAIFQHVHGTTFDADRDGLALYVTRPSIAPVALYVSPLATERMRVAAPGFDIADCEPPAREELDLLVGMDLLGSDAPDMERAA